MLLGVDAEDDPPVSLRMLHKFIADGRCLVSKCDILSLVVAKGRFIDYPLTD